LAAKAKKDWRVKLQGAKVEGDLLIVCIIIIVAIVDEGGLAKRIG